MFLSSPSLRTEVKSFNDGPPKARAKETIFALNLSEKSLNPLAADSTSFRAFELFFLASVD